MKNNKTSKDKAAKYINLYHRSRHRAKKHQDKMEKYAEILEQMGWHIVRKPHEDTEPKHLCGMAVDLILGEEVDLTDCEPFESKGNTKHIWLGGRDAK